MAADPLFQTIAAAFHELGAGDSPISHTFLLRDRCFVGHRYPSPPVQHPRHALILKHVHRPNVMPTHGKVRRVGRMKQILETPRLVLRDMSLADLDVVAAMLADPEVTVNGLDGAAKNGRRQELATV